MAWQESLTNLAEVLASSDFDQLQAIIGNANARRRGTG
jgi:hypothetical protein